MSNETALLTQNQLPAVTFNGLAGPQQSWSCGNIRLISNAGSYLERLTSICGPREAIAKIVDLVVQSTEQCLSNLPSERTYDPTIGIGWWQGEQWGLLIYMEVSGGAQPTVPLADILNANLELMNDVYLLRGVDHPMWGCSDTYWSMLEIGHKKPEQREAAFDLALQLCSTRAMAGGEPEEGEEPDAIFAPNPSDIYQLTRDIYELHDTFVDWNLARTPKDVSQGS